MSRQIALPLPHREAMGADDFMLSDSNREAVAWIDAWPDWASPCLALQGPPGSGKTHLTQVWLAKSGGIAVTLGDLASISAGDIAAKGKHIAIDDVERIAGNTAQEEALFHLYNRLKDDKGSLFLTGVAAPAQWPVKLPDLHSRLATVPVAQLGSPDDELLSALLVKQFHDRQVEIADGVLAFILSRIERTPAAVRDIVDALDKASLASGGKITTALAKQMLTGEPKDSYGF